MKKHIAKFTKYLIKKIFDPRTLYIWTLAALLVPNIILDITERYNAAMCITNILLPGGIYALLLCFRRKIGIGVLLTFPFMLYAAFQIVLSYLYGESIIAVDMFLNVVTTNADEVGELLGNLVIPISTVVVLYLPPLILAVFSIVKKHRLQHNFFKQALKYASASTIAGIILCIVLAITISPVKVFRDLFPINVIGNMIEAINRNNKINKYELTSATFRYNSASERDASQKEVYVFVVGETSRAINWELNDYNRPTNPNLKNCPRVVSFKKSLSQSNTTHKSVPMLISHISAENFDSIYYSKSIITAMKEAGFKTYFLSNQTANHSFTEWFGDEADVVKYTSHTSGIHPYDKEILQWFDEAVADTINNKKFIVLHTYGSHFLYRDRYPSDFAYFVPDDAIDANKSNRESLINAYDNSIRYTDLMLSDIITRLDSTDGYAAMVYSADHGEDIFDDPRNRFLHASPNPTYYQLHVATLSWVNDSLNNDYPALNQSLKINSNKVIAPQKALFHTMLNLAGVKTTFYKQNESLTDSTYMPTTATYLTDLNKCIPLEKAIRNKTDLTLIKNIEK